MNKKTWQFKKLNPTYFLTAGEIFLWLSVLITFIAKFAPFTTRMPSSGLDASWQFGINQAVKQGLAFGTDIIFTFGPYASIYSKLYHPSTDFMMVAGSLFLAVSFWVYFVLIMRGVHWIWSLIFILAIGGLRYSQDAFLFSLPFLFGIMAFKIFSFQDVKWIKSKLAPLYLALLVTPLGLLPLVKGSFFILCVLYTGLCSLFIFTKKYRVLSLICMLSPILSLFIFWVLSGQSILNLSDYLVSMVSLSYGYSEAMSTDGNTGEIVLFLFASTLLLIAIFISKRFVLSSKVFLFFVCFVFLFLSFKAGFIRHDAHAKIAGTSILIAALLLPFFNNNRLVIPVIIIALITWYYIDSNYAKSTRNNFRKNLVSTYSRTWVDLTKRIENNKLLVNAFDSAVKSIRFKASIPILKGTTDIYSFNQSNLISSGNKWSPRPVFQSYTVFSPALAEINMNYLLGRKAPDNIIFAVETIDGRFPAIEDGASWPVLLLNYLPTRMENNYLILQKKERRFALRDKVGLMDGTYFFGENIFLPPSNKPIFAQFDIKSTFLGRITSIFYKPTQLFITLELKNGIIKRYRIPVGMAHAGFIISPLIETTTEFGLLYGQSGYLERKRIKSITVSSDDEKSLLWKNKFTVTFSQIRSCDPVDFSSVKGFFETIIDSIPPGYTETQLVMCEGSIDYINGMTPSPEMTEASRYLSFEGWLAYSSKNGIAPDDIYISMKRTDGVTKYLTTHRMPRSDVNEAIKKPNMKDVGFKATIDISDFRGDYIFGLAMGYQGRLFKCDQFKKTVRIGMPQ